MKRGRRIYRDTAGVEQIASGSRGTGYPIPDTANGCVCLEVAINSKTARR